MLGRELWCTFSTTAEPSLQRYPHFVIFIFASRKLPFRQEMTVYSKYVSRYLKCPGSFKGTAHKYSMVNCKTNAIILMDKNKVNRHQEAWTQTLEVFPKEAVILLLTVFNQRVLQHQSWSPQGLLSSCLESPLRK